MHNGQLYNNKTLSHLNENRHHQRQKLPQQNALLLLKEHVNSHFLKLVKHTTKIKGMPVIMTQQHCVKEATFVQTKKEKHANIEIPPILADETSGEILFASLTVIIHHNEFDHLPGFLTQQATRFEIASLSFARLPNMQPNNQLTYTLHFLFPRSLYASNSIT